VTDVKCINFKDLYSCTLRKLLERPEEVSILMPQEVRVGAETRWIDMALGSEVIFEFKSSEKEFSDAEKAAREKYWPIVSKAKFFIVTNWSKWRIYEVVKEDLQLLCECDVKEALNILKTQIIPQLK
jgi:hypothetical protein